MVDPSDGGHKSAGGLVQSRPPEEGSFSRRLKVQRSSSVLAVSRVVFYEKNAFNLEIVALKASILASQLFAITQSCLVLSGS